MHSDPKTTLNALARGQTGESAEKSGCVITGLTLVDAKTSIASGGAIAMRRGKIAAVGTDAEVLAAEPQLPRLDGRGFTAIPGLINAHTHSAMGFFRDLGHGKDGDMIETFLFPAEKSLTPELIEPLSYSYLVDGLKSGVTTFVDHYYFVDGVGRALDNLGLRGVIGETIGDLGGAFPDGRAAWQRARASIERWPHSDRIKPAVAPHAADTVSRSLLAEIAGYAKGRDLPIHMHLAQTYGEVARVKAREGVSPVAYVEACGALTPMTLAVHLVATGADDVARLQANGATAGLCPASQICYAHLMPFQHYAAAGVPLALGTDCAACNDGADMLAELRLLALLAKDRQTNLSWQDVLATATTVPARTLGLGGEIGQLTAGMSADVVFLAQDITNAPLQNPIVNLLMSCSARHVRHVMVAGRFVLADGEPTRMTMTAMTEAYSAAILEINKRLRR